jgi:steroid delta-isomerase-like uncharacterized protein
MKPKPIALATLLALVACGGREPPPVTTAATPLPPPVAPPPAPAASLPLDAAPVPTPAPPSVASPSLADLVADRNKTALEALNAHDRKKLASTYAENATITMFGEGDITGRDAIAAEFAQTLMGLPDLKASFARTWAKNDVEVLEWVVAGAGPKPAGLVGLSVLTFAPDGLVTSEHRYRDTPTLLRQLGFAKGDVRPVSLPSATESHAAHGTPEEDANLASLAKWYAAINAHKADAFALVSDDATLDDATADAPTTGRKEIQRRFGRLWKAFPDLKAEPSTPMAVEDFTVSEVVVRGTQKGALGPLKASKKTMAIHQADVVQWKDGKIARAWVYGNAKEMLDQLSTGKK